MESVNIPGVLQPVDDEIAVDKHDGSKHRLQGAVDIVDHYVSKCDSRSDSTYPINYQYDEYAVGSTVAPHESCDSLESPIKPLRKLSQCSENRKSNTCSDITSIRASKKVSFSDELPMVNNDISGGVKKDEQSASIHYQMTKESDTIRDGNDKGYDSINSTSTHLVNELGKDDIFPNSRKFSLHLEHPLNMNNLDEMSQSERETTTDQIIINSETPLGTFLEHERKMSTSSVKSKVIPSNIISYLKIM